MPTLEERVKALEEFVGSKEKIQAYANTIEDICNTYLTILYFENYSSRPSGTTYGDETLYVDSYIGTMTKTDEETGEVIPWIKENRLITIKANHNVIPNDSGETYVAFHNDQYDDIKLPLKKYKSSDTAEFLVEDDYKLGDTLTIYVTSDQVAIVSVSDKGEAAYEKVTSLQKSFDTLNEKVEAFSNSFTTNILKVNTRSQLDGITNVNSLTPSSMSIPTGATCDEPTSDSGIANRKYVNETIDTKILEAVSDYLNGGTGEASEALADKPDHAIYFKY